VLAIVLGLLVGLAAAAWWLVPPWLERRASDEITARLGRLLEQPVTVGSVDVELPRLVIHDLVVGEPGATLVRLDEIEVVLDEDALWSGRAEPVDARVRGGAITGERGQLEDVLARVRTRAAAPKPEERSRVRLLPEHVTVRDVALDLWQGEREGARRRVEGVLGLTADVVSGTATVELLRPHLRHESVPTVGAAALRTTLVLVRTEQGRRPRFPLVFEVERAGAQVTPQIAIAGVDGRITIADEEVSEVAVDLQGGFSDRDDGRAEARLWSLAGRIERGLGEGELEVSMDSFELGRAPEVLARLPVVDSESATVGGRVALKFGAGLARVEGRVRLDGLNVSHRLLARETVRDVGFDLDFAVELEPAKPRVTLHHATIERGGVELRLRGEVQHPAEPSDRRYRIHAEVPSTPCQDVLRAIPAALVPSLQGFDLKGSFDLSVDVEVDYADLDALVLDGGVGLAGCRVVDRPPRAAAERLAGVFTHQVTMRDGQVRSVHLYPGSGTFTPLDQISPYMVQAVLTTEDGGFWRHKGFLPSQFRTALHRNLEAGRVRLGASTITMQMVKNVLLSHERTLARKLQEMILTWYVETALTKERILEIYLNIVELGPGIYGVTRAAQHYFGKQPAQLTPPEAVYLALMLPSPVRRHANYCEGMLSPRFEVKVARILRIMNERKRLDDLDYEIWKETPVEFDLRERGDSGACLGEIEALMEAQQGQRALSGLLGAPGDVVFEPPPLGYEEDPGFPEELEDPANADAPGTPAMDDVLGDGLP